jgi:hypothetical protein
MNQLMNALDMESTGYAFSNPNYNFQGVLRNGEHLEHLHSYFGSTSSRGSSDIDASLPTMPLHTDDGLFIAMTTGYFTSNELNIKSQKENNLFENGLYIQLPTGKIAKASTADGLSSSLIVMVGNGGNKWLNPVLGKPLRAVPHALIANLKKGDTRSWYGKMFLPPSDAVLAMTSPTMTTDKITYGTYRKNELNVVTKSNKESGSILPVACDGSLQSDDSSVNSHILMNTQCTLDNGDPGVMCWLQCLSTSDLPCGMNAQCVDTATGEPVDGTIMCPSADGMSACELECLDVKSVQSSNTNTDYCYGTGVSMFMEGFVSISQEKEGSTACVNILFKDWTLNTKVKYAFGCIGVFLLGIFIEMLTMIRRRLYKEVEWSRNRDIAMVIIHSLQVLLSYFIMLIAMTYSVELFCMVCSGLVVGYIIFNLSAPPVENTDPCCAHIDSVDDSTILYDKLLDNRKM